MKQTSQAIALLIATAAASTSLAPTTNFQSTASQTMAVNSAPSNAGQAQSRVAAYVQRPPTGWSWAVGIQYNKSILAADGTTAFTDVTTTTNGSTCMRCLGGLDSVWCSRTYSFAITGVGVSAYQQAASTYALSMDISQTKATSSGTMWNAATALDQGSCCNSKANFVALIGTAGVATSATNWTPTNTTSKAGISGQKTDCVAFDGTITTASGPANLFAVASFDTGTAAYSSWWCSNGLYKNVTTAASVYTRNVVQTFSQNENNRLDLAMVGCPNLAKVCGAASSTGVYGTGVYTLSTATAVTVTVPMASTLAFNDKCTWVATSYLYAPTFKMEAGTDAKGIVNSNWNLHHMEYMTRSDKTAFEPQSGLLIQTSNTAAGAVTANEGIGIGNYVPKLNMPASQFATLRTWYGSGIGLTANVFASGATPFGGQSGQWYTPYQQGVSNTSALSANFATVNNNQYLGNVSNMPASSMTSIATTAGNVTAGQNYGNNGPTYYDFRVIRYLPVSAAQTVWTAGSNLNTMYSGKVTAYTTAKTTWNAYVAILKKNAKMDAFAAAFSPPKAPTVPPLPNMPWTPSAYSGYLKQTPSQNYLMINNQVGTSATNGPYVSASQPTAQQFWASLDAAQSIGGWGVWTAQIITYRNLWGKSFGTIGYSGATGFDTMSQIWSYQQQCSSANTAATGGACDASYSGTGTTATAGVVTGNGDNATSWQFITVISLWSTGDTSSSSAAGVWASQHSLQLVFTGKTWSSSLGAMSTISQPTAPTAADSLTGVAGASALAASSAAVLAIAALY